MCLSQEIEEPPATLNASAQKQCKPESSVVVNLLMIYTIDIVGATTRK